MVLIDFHAAGHHPTYLKLYADALGDQLVALSAPASEPQNSIPESVRRLPVFSPSWSRYWRWKGASTLLGIERFLSLRRVLRQFEKDSGGAIDQVHFACLYDENFRGSAIWRFFWKWSWSALYLHPVFDFEGEPRLRSWMTLPTLKSLALLDETRISRLEALTSKKCVRMPDTVYCGSAEGELSRRITLLKGDRFALLLSGFLHPQKGVLDFLSLAEKLDPAEYFFVMVGAIHFPDYSPPDQERLLRFSQEQENGFAYFHRVIEESSLNGVIEICDLVFAAYRDWKFSSNAVGKAAAFRKPIIVSAGELMADRVSRFQLGTAVPQGDIGTMVTTVDQLRKMAKEEISSADWDGYLHEHSYEAFAESVADLVNEESV